MITHAPLYTHAVCQPLTGHIIRQNGGPALGCKLRLATQSSPSGQNFASLELDLSYLLPRESHEGPLLRTVARVIKSQNRLGRDLGQTSVSPEPGSALDICDKGHPDVIGYSEADTSLKKRFLILSIVSTIMVWATPP
jgi:hypothetical protein